MKTVVSPDKFKGSLTATQVAIQIKNSLNRACSSFDVVTLPLSDGGEGLSDLFKNDSYREITVKTKDPLERSITSSFLFVPDKNLAVIEMSSASGLALLQKDEYNPLMTTTYGTGQMILKALDLGVNHIILGLGGSATNDGGIGMASALGYKFLDAEKKDLTSIGKSLELITSIDTNTIDNRLKNTRFTAICDVDNTFYGESGAAKVYAKQKGASPQEIDKLDAGLQNLSKLIKSAFQIDLQEVKGSGAAGGLGGGALTFLGAELKNGIETVIEYLNFEQRCADADLIITGEGKLDQTSLNGKVISGVTSVANKLGIPVIAICGEVEGGSEILKKIGLTAAYSILPECCNVESAIINTLDNLDFTSYNLGRTLSALSKD